jgi:hypothetical protein
VSGNLSGATRRRFGVHFGANSVQVNLATPNSDTQGVYAATENGKISVVIVNKNPNTPITFALANLPFGSYFVRHFGGAAGIAKWQVRVELLFPPNRELTGLTDDCNDQLDRLHCCARVHGRVLEAKLRVIFVSFCCIMWAEYIWQDIRYRCDCPNYSDMHVSKQVSLKSEPTHHHSSISAQ